MQTLSDRIIWDKDDFLAGMVPAQLNNAMRIFGIRGSTFHKDIDPLFAAVPGTLEPSGVATDLTGVASTTFPDALLVSVVTDPIAAFGYALGGAKVHQITVATLALTVAGGTFPHLVAAGAHAGHTTESVVLGDLAVFNVAGTSKLFYSWNDNMDWDVGVYDFVTMFDDDFMSTAATTPLGTTVADLTGGVGKPHPLYVGQDGILYIGSGRFVHAYDGTSFVSQDLDLPIGYDVIGFAETGLDLVIFATNARDSGRRGSAKAFFWDASRPSSFYQVIDLEDDTVSAPFNYQGTVACFTASRNIGGFSTLRIFNGRRFEPIFLWNGALPGIKGVTTLNNLIIFNSSGIIYAVGARDGLFPNGRFIIRSGTGTDAGGIVFPVIGGTLIASTGVGASGGLQQFATSTYSAGAFWHGLTACPNFPRGRKGKVVEVKVTFAGVATGGRSLELSLKTNSGQTSSTIFTGLVEVTSNGQVKRYTAKSSGADLPEFENIRPNFTWSTGSGATSAPVVEKLEVFYKLVDIK